ncbi:MAG: hypothetical protein ACLFNM_00355 [Candidatus Woesearchaeota archaeon]
MKRKYSKAWVESIIELIILVFLIPLLFSVAWFVGVMYTIAILGAVVSGILFKKKGIALLIIIGTVLSYCVTLLFPTAKDAYTTGDYISFGVIALLALSIWFIAWKIKQGK